MEGRSGWNQQSIRGAPAFLRSAGRTDKKTDHPFPIRGTAASAALKKLFIILF
jgi:hypothetical protein